MKLIHARAWPAAFYLTLALGAVACSATEGGARRPGAGQGGSSGGGAGVGGSSGGGFTATGGAVASGGGGFGAVNSSGGTGGDPPVCGTAKAETTIVTAPVDIIIALDNSGSMVEEMGAAEANINTNFAAILTSRGVDYRVILISRHRQEERSASEEASTSICVAQPLSGLAACPAEAPVFSDRFFQFGMKVESTDSFDRMLAWYNSPDTENDMAPNGWSEWLRVGSKKVIVEMTDDNEDMPAETFITNLTNLSTQHFGTPAAPNFTFHSIVGIAEKADPTAAYTPDEPINPAMCTGNGADIENAGETYQQLSILTQGLRFPLCQFPGYDAVFRAIAENVIQTTILQCDFEIPAPPDGKALDLEKVAVSYTKGDGSGAVQFGQAASSAECQPNAFYIENNRIYLCPASCDSVKADPFASVDVLFTCERTILPPPE